MKKFMLFIIVGALFSVTLIENVNGEEMSFDYWIHEAEDLEEIVLYKDNDKFISVLVSSEQKADYLEYIADEMNLQEEIQSANQVYESYNSYLRTPGNCKVSYYTIRDVYRTLDRLDSNGGWTKYISNPFSALGISLLQRRVASIFGYSNFWVVLGSLIIGMGTSLQQRQRTWWADSAIMMSKKQITGVRTRQCENISGSNYPAAYRFIERY